MVQKEKQLSKKSSKTFKGIFEQHIKIINEMIEGGEGCSFDVALENVEKRKREITQKDTQNGLFSRVRSTNPPVVTSFPPTPITQEAS